MPSCTTPNTASATNLRRELPRIPFVGNDGTSTSPDISREAAQECSPRREPWVNEKEDSSTLPEAVAGERSSEATQKFRAFVRAGQRLAEIHLHYEQQPEYPLTKTEKAREKLDYRVEKMKLSKDKTSLIYNQFLTLSGIPKETYEYRLGNRSALE